MQGAEALLRTALAAGVDTIFSNPGTTEMDLVRAIDAVPEVRSVLALFEGVVTGMADGYGRMRRSPSLTLLHLGVGVGNGIANLHNARRAQSPVVNLVGDHPREHLPFDAPLTSDIETMARPVSDWVKAAESVGDAVGGVAEAIAFARSAPGHICTLITPSDMMHGAWEGTLPTVPARRAECASDEAVETAARALRSGNGAALLVSGDGALEAGLAAGGRASHATGCRFLVDSFPGRFDRGAGRAMPHRLPYFPEMVQERLAGLKYLVLAGAQPPVSFFKYEGVPSSLVPEGCTVVALAAPDQDVTASLEALADALDAPASGYPTAEQKRAFAPEGAIDTKTFAAALSAALPEHAIVSDESATSGGPAFFATSTCPPHSSMYLTGGGIGMGLPLATGAAVACPDRPVVALQGDGGAMYTFQSLWTQAREGLNVTNVIFANRKYEILNWEMARAGIDAPGARARALTSLDDPPIDFCGLAKSLGVPAFRPESAEELHRMLDTSFREPGPTLIEVVL